MAETRHFDNAEDFLRGIGAALQLEIEFRAEVWYEPVQIVDRKRYQGSRPGGERLLRKYRLLLHIRPDERVHVAPPDAPLSPPEPIPPGLESGAEDEEILDAQGGELIPEMSAAEMEKRNEAASISVDYVRINYPITHMYVGSWADRNASYPCDFQYEDGTVCRRESKDHAFKGGEGPRAIGQPRGVNPLS